MKTMQARKRAWVRTSMVFLFSGIRKQIHFERMSISMRLLVVAAEGPRGYNKQFDIPMDLAAKESEAHIGNHQHVSD